VITPTVPPQRPLTDKQRVVLSIIARYYIENGEPISVRLLARRLGCHPTTATFHLQALHRKGWIPAPAVPKPVLGRIPPA
jgi:transcriptional regulator of heat shock response